MMRVCRVLRRREISLWRLLAASCLAACSTPVEREQLARTTASVPSSQSALGQWIWTRADIARFAETATTHPELEAGIFIGSVHCDAATGRLTARAGLSAAAPNVAAVTPVIRFEDGLYACRRPRQSAESFDAALDSAVHVLRGRVHHVAVHAVQLDYDAPQRGLAAWSRTVRYLRARSLAGDLVWITSLIAHLREPEYGALFRDVVDGHVLQVFDTGEESSAPQIAEALRLTTRAALPFRVGLGAFERETRDGPTDHRAWFAVVPKFADVHGYRGVWVFPAGQRWITYLRETA
jgi:hypothetical protein